MIDSIYLTREEIEALGEFFSTSLESSDVVQDLSVEAIQASEKVYEKILDVQEQVEEFDVDSVNIEVWVDE